MATSLFRRRSTLIIPLVLILVAILEDIAMYKVRQVFRTVYERAAILVLLNGVGFGIAAEVIGPRLQRFLDRARRESKGAGSLGLWLFYALAYGLVFYAYVVTERFGPGALLPARFR